MENQERRSNTGLIVIIVILLIVIGILGVLYYNQSKDVEKHVATIDTKSKEVVSKTQELEKLLADYEQLRTERERLGLRNDSLDSQISQLNNYISELKRTNKISKSELSRLNAEIDKYKLQVANFARQIDSLKVMTDSLSTSVTTLTEERTQLGDSLSKVNTRVSEASVLEAENIKIVALKENGKEIDDDENEFKLKKIDRIKITFSLGKNSIALKNQKDIYMAFVSPTGDVFSDANSGGGEFAAADGQTVKYTMKQSVNFDNTRQKLSFTTLKGFGYKPGLHVIELWAEGHKIGEGSFVIKG